MNPDFIKYCRIRHTDFYSSDFTDLEKACIFAQNCNIYLCIKRNSKSANNYFSWQSKDKYLIPKSGCHVMQLLLPIIISSASLLSMGSRGKRMLTPEWKLLYRILQ